MRPRVLHPGEEPRSCHGMHVACGRDPDRNVGHARDGGGHAKSEREDQGRQYLPGASKGRGLAGPSRSVSPSPHPEPPAADTAIMDPSDATQQVAARLAASRSAYTPSCCRAVKGRPVRKVLVGIFAAAIVLGDSVNASAAVKIVKTKSASLPENVAGVRRP
jgi:hypothetical protein